MKNHINTVDDDDEDDNEKTNNYCFYLLDYFGRKLATKSLYDDDNDDE